MEIFFYLQDPGINMHCEIFKDGVQLWEAVSTTPNMGFNFFYFDPKINVPDLKGRMKSGELEYSRQDKYEARFSKGWDFNR